MSDESPNFPTSALNPDCEVCEGDPKQCDCHVMGPNWTKRLHNIDRDCQVEGWNSYHSAAVTPVVIKTAYQLCLSLDVVPTNDGGIQISMASEGIAVELSSDGYVTNVWVDIKDTANWIDIMRTKDV